MCLRFMESELPEEIDVALDMEHEGIASLNEMCAAIEKLSPSDRLKLGAAVALAQPDYSSQVMHLAQNLEFFEFIPGAKTAEDYGCYMIQDSEHFEYDENLADFYDYEKYGRQRMEYEYGQFVARGYISYHGTLSLDELMMEDPAEQEQDGFEMGGME